MLCAYCQGFNFRSIAAEVIANNEDPLASPNNKNEGSYFFKYHSTMVGIHSAILEGCDLCSLLWETWLENSKNWVWEYDIFSDDEESNQENQTADYKSGIANTPESFSPILSLKLGRLWLGPVLKDAGPKITNAQMNRDEGETEIRPFRQVAIGICFEIQGIPKSSTPNEGKVTLGIYAEAGITF